jgi:riboflavin synthase
VTVDGRRCSFDVITETLSKTNLGRLQVGSKVNLERSLRAGDRIDGHFVQGHVHDVGHLVERVATDKEFKLWIQPPDHLKVYIVPLGSVAVNGVSMTVAQVRPDAFALAVIPTTLERTNLGDLQVGDPINIETDILSRQLVHYLRELDLPALLTSLRQ